MPVTLSDLLKPGFNTKLDCIGMTPLYDKGMLPIAYMTNFSSDDVNVGDRLCLVVIKKDEIEPCLVLTPITPSNVHEPYRYRCSEFGRLQDLEQHKQCMSNDAEHGPVVLE